MADSFWATQTAIYSALTGAAAVTALVSTRVYDEVQQNATFPYIEIGEAVGEDWGTKTRHGLDQSISIHIWSRYAGMKEAKQIANAIHDALHDATLTISGHDAILCRFEFGEFLLDPDGLTRHGIVRYRVVTQG